VMRGGEAVGVASTSGRRGADGEADGWWLGVRRRKEEGGGPIGLAQPTGPTVRWARGAGGWGEVG
jgi:hypothetical protein